LTQKDHERIPRSTYIKGGSWDVQHDDSLEGGGNSARSSVRLNRVYEIGKVVPSGVWKPGHPITCSCGGVDGR